MDYRYKSVCSPSTHPYPALGVPAIRHCLGFVPLTAASSHFDCKGKYCSIICNLVAWFYLVDLTVVSTIDHRTAIIAWTSVAFNVGSRNTVDCRCASRARSGGHHRISMDCQTSASTIGAGRLTKPSTRLPADTGIFLDEAHRVPYTSVCFGLGTVEGRRHAGSGSASTEAQSCAALSKAKIPLRPFARFTPSTSVRHTLG